MWINFPPVNETTDPSRRPGGGSSGGTVRLARPQGRFGGPGEKQGPPSLKGAGRCRPGAPKKTIFSLSARGAEQILGVKNWGVPREGGWLDPPPLSHPPPPVHLGGGVGGHPPFSLGFFWFPYNEKKLLVLWSSQRDGCRLAPIEAEPSGEKPEIVAGRKDSRTVAG